MAGEWVSIKDCPTDKALFWAYDSKHRRVMARCWFEGATRHLETWAYDPSGLIDAPDPHMWWDGPVPDSAPPLPA